ncbi:hypothetical protein I6A60_26790 [Frankia sp. AgB1.9]|uniref:Uncharacterized protein n=1 Tax=Pseudofrankia inefficax (strain DSM 45817 / CECT 9037 / DDB 130130 / EuI1c) TaxID=298654 RepID=E3J6V8_PSEI1|nr:MULTISPECIES: hypothetical protein [Frankiaceae]ADP83178.1 hypothetical protein FraEuI1c_5189 [Pseudofrankia inefficax]MBL7488587.1 hypothetical protein [Frankia sp. AgW1.1]MBL7551435.1 hypothetical protein [Frankia sp. AgB1.9]MBL7619786.1 hypothetical protein [Frankia sp. AgB1.8]
MTAKIRAFFAFWYDFIVGDDWRVALGVALGVAATGAIHTAIPAWWLLPLAVAVLLPFTLWRASRSH